MARDIFKQLIAQQAIYIFGSNSIYRHSKTNDESII